jgi:hypothetical protein
VGALGLGLGLAGVVLLAAGCGAGSKSPSIATLGTTTAGSGRSSNAGPFALPPGGAGIGASISTDVGTGAAGVRFTACMRSHGVPNFPDPDSRGTITITVSTSLDPRSPGFQRAAADCQHLLPAGRAPSQAQQQRMKEAALAFAACMRAHGVPRYPDPTFSNGGISQGYGPSGGVDPASPVFQAAQKSCQGARNCGG